jgi:predicted RNA-binding Zn ribbon-like protein
MGYNAGMRPTAPVFDLSGGALCLDFVNTVGGHRALRPREMLRGYGDLLAWARQAGVLTPAEATRLAARASREPRRAVAALGRARAARERLYRVFAARAAGAEPAAADLADLNRDLARALPHLRLAPDAAGLAWSWDDPLDLERPLWPVLRSAADLLTAAPTGRLRECAAETCSWLFLDRSRPGGRRWCDMQSCGNRAKARRHYHRVRALRRARG